MEESFRRISLVAREIIRAIPNSEGQIASSKPCQVPSLSLPPPDSIYAYLLKENVQPIAATEISDLFCKSLGNVQSEVRSAFANMWTKVAALPRHERMLPLDMLRNELVQTFEKYYAAKVDGWLKDIRTAITSRRLALNPNLYEQKRSGSDAGESCRNPIFNRVGFPFRPSPFYVHWHT